MQSVSSRIWTRVAVPNFYDDNHYKLMCVSVIELGQTSALRSWKNKKVGGFDKKNESISLLFGCCRFLLFFFFVHFLFLLFSFGIISIYIYF